MATIGNTFGAMEIGSIITVFLFGIVTLQTHMYFERFSQDRIPFKILVVGIWLLELGNTMAVVYEVYRVTIIYYGNPGGATRHPALGMVVIFGTYIATIIQIFNCYRLYSIIPKPYNIVGLFAGVLAFGRAIVVTYAGVLEIKATSYAANIKEMHDWIMALLAMGAVIDIIIAVSMVYFLLTKREKDLVKTTTLIDKLIAFALRTGLITSINAVAVIIVFGTMPNNLIFFAVYSSLSKLYTNSLLSGFNARVSLRDTLNKSISGGLPHRTDGPSSRYPQENTYNKNVISIQMKTTTEFRSDDASFDPADLSHLEADRDSFKR
ncbi:hypothetical protein HYPSUDRAFT_79441 [Hypholoma sublateritium FD-334 SS-4]|uniref:DUF6534 domain-containing protein n=1 Tax=Hypholoma sublateritium (strain FD-334 SS-4) TaxID=945553 RepID=A0A0D2NG48_HYPSF|nr:hypothetical protein HYPSUDRAFT_79441 [Hypholoma sublateritium FD-334 SS-4]